MSDLITMKKYKLNNFGQIVRRENGDESGISVSPVIVRLIDIFVASMVIFGVIKLFIFIL